MDKDVLQKPEIKNKPTKKKNLSTEALSEKKIIKRLQIWANQHENGEINERTLITEENYVIYSQ